MTSQTETPLNTRAFTEGLPGKRMAAGVLFTNASGRLLLVRPTYKAYWDLPGGLVERNETPRDAAAREVKEELGLVVDVGRLLVVDYFPDSQAATEALMFVFDGGILTSAEQAQILLQPDELQAWAWNDIPTARVRTEAAPLLFRRIDAASRARRDGCTHYLEAGMLPAGQQGMNTLGSA